MKPDSLTPKPYDLEDQHIAIQPNGPAEFLTDILGEIVKNNPNSGYEMEEKINADEKSNKDCVIRFDNYYL